jgi:hypothetical protein
MRKVTLKVFANSSPGLSFGNPGNKHSSIDDATLKKLRRCPLKAVATLSELRPTNGVRLIPHGFKANPGLELVNAFSVRLMFIDVAYTQVSQTLTSILIWEDQAN